MPSTAISPVAETRYRPGKFLDPLADKILVCAALLALVELQTFPSWVALVIIAREFIVSGLRMVAASQGKVIAASIFGKFKTVLQICAILLFTVKDSLQITAHGRRLLDMLHDLLVARLARRRHHDDRLDARLLLQVT